MTGSDLLQTEHAEDRVNKGGTDYLKKASAETRKKILGGWLKEQSHLNAERLPTGEH